jgi:hypothetical protein
VPLVALVCWAVLGCCSPTRRLARRSVQPASSGGRRRRGRQCRDASRGVGRRSASSLRCPPIRLRRPGVRLSGRPVSSPSGVRSPRFVVRDPASGRTVSTRPASSRPVSSRLVSSRPVSTPSVRTRPSRPTPGGGGGSRAGAAGTLPTGTGRGPGGRPRRGAARSTAEAWTRAVLPSLLVGQWVSWQTQAGLVRARRRPRLPAERPGQARPALGSARRSHRARAREQAAARGCCIGRVAAVLGWVGDHAEWSSRSLIPGGRAPKGQWACRPGLGVRPQRGPGSRRALPGRCRQRPDLREWLVGLPGLEPGTSSLSAIPG